MPPNPSSAPPTTAATLEQTAILPQSKQFIAYQQHQTSPSFLRWRNSMSFFLYGPAKASEPPTSKSQAGLVASLMKPPPQSINDPENEGLSGRKAGLTETVGDEVSAGVNDLGDQAQRERCEKWTNIVVKDSPLLHFLIQNLKKSGCPFDPKLHFKCAPCDKSRAGGFSPEVGVVLCQNSLYDKKHVEETLAHELIHAYDHCTTRVDWTSCRQYACSEIRASSLSTECGALREFRRGNFGITKGHQACVKRRAILSVRQNPFCTRPGLAERVVEEVFDTCFQDTAPFDEIYP
ncbi:hypothetical protein M427DRAFT_63815 [Gonapodya prolifera JEL478]|uniref:Mitochondrial inner membrane protease ATP23 n=1 Tax=Gonapodya prolifera (strain JEL478) TaxID=1344416 RepID=A0A138ZYN6_GONPJ|nr:hypothetical protein M427DRAFT_63815 [Gonapodya prolifera JEL478]|eukprot:KXS09617.1 hypothetical protein M427DRAFT_63815 [Gonapodya prolifera JEL478]